MVGGGSVHVPDDFVPLAHVERAYRNSECRTPIVLVLADGDPFQSICKLAKARGCAVWHIEMGNEKNEQNAIDYVDVGIQNGDWVYLTSNECASQNVLRTIAKTIVTLEPEPKKYPRREFFRIWFAVDKPISLNDNIACPFPRLLVKNAILARTETERKAASPNKWSKKMPEEPELFTAEALKHQTRRDAGRDSDSESDADDPEKKITGMWFHRAVDLYTFDNGSAGSKASEEIYTAIDAQDAAKIAELCKSGQIDLARLRRDGMTPLQYACSREKTESARILLEAGADPNQARDSDGCPPLFMTLEDEALVKTLLDHGADYNFRFESHRLEHHSATAPHIADYMKKFRATFA